MGQEQDRVGNPAFGEFVLDRADERLVGPSGVVRIGNKAFRVLALLVEQQGRLITKDALFSSVWDGTLVSESSLTSVVKELRRALGDESRAPRYIESVYGRGYRFIAPVRLEGAAPAVADPTPPPRPPSVVPEPDHDRPPLVLVSAFHDEAVRDLHPYCAEDLREEVLSGLARVREIHLLAGDEGDPRLVSQQAAQRGYRLGATLLPSSRGVKVIARATRLADGLVVWAETMSLADGGTAGGVEKIVRRIVGAALPALDDDLLHGLPKDPGNLYDAYLIAKRRSYTAKSFDEAREAANALERIIAERPDFGLAYPPLVRLYHTDFSFTAFGSTGPEQRARALKLARDGLAADRSNAHAHSVLGWAYLWHEERALARRCFDQALALNPYNHVRVQEAATALTYLGDFGGARGLMERAEELNPCPDDDFYEDSGRLRLAEGDYEGARASLLSLAHGSVWAELYLGACEVALGSDGATERLAGWRRKVGLCWHGGEVPAREQLLGWIRRHHPLPGDAGERFFGPIEKGL